MTGKNIICEVSEDEMMVRAGKFYEICLKFLLKVDKSTTKAEFDTKTRALSVTVNLQVSKFLVADFLQSFRKSKTTKTRKNPRLMKERKL